ncbi:MAG: thioredoxin domain-containing protein [Pseudomonadota bacterium]
MNRLEHETSLYLQQHADNPVEWWPWNEAALQAARESRKPILLSVGYSACHWCHVMAHECFENPDIAAVMNAHFINIKVDREERPDIDKVYQTAHQLMAQRAGGWPLTMFLTPDEQLPFFGGTYFPPTAQHGLPAFTEVLEKVAEFHSSNPEEAARQGAAVQSVFSKLEPEPNKATTSGEDVAAKVRAALEQQHDSDNGGFGRAPKFPQIPSLRRLLNAWRDTATSSEPDLQALLMATLSMTRMIEGGLFDQVGGGFFRYCVDARWQIPHFEKMLYDNGLLLELAVDLHQATGEPLFRDAGQATIDWLFREMRSPEGTFFATLDADADGVEGATYTVTPEAVRSELPEPIYERFAARYGLTQAANFEGRWHLTVHDRDVVLTDPELAQARDVLIEARKQRPQPGRDEKIVTTWNSLALKGLARAAVVFGDSKVADAAERAADRLRETVWRANRLHSVWQAGQCRSPGFLDDYATLADALLDLTQMRWRGDWFDWSVALAEQLVDRFHDREAGGFFFSPDDGEQLMYRSKPLGDDATPAGNAVAVRVLSRLGHLLGRTEWITIADETVNWARPTVADYPQAHVSMIESIQLHQREPEMIVLRGMAEQLTQWQRDIQTIYAPNRCVFAIPSDAVGLHPALAAHSAPAQGVTAYICEGLSCRAPITDWRELAAAIRNR